jgi:hypothetical protein
LLYVFWILDAGAQYVSIIPNKDRFSELATKDTSASQAATILEEQKINDTSRKRDTGQISQDD